ncbi:hypothetical protein PAXINDRAFT_106684 [Paxillus involutus ATCC 200175]|nr:hypothetical protein PAXINDRAFT_106684 [Paxillus involutus ATCC 200175]
MDLLSPTTTNSTPISQYHSLLPSPAVDTSALSSASSSSVELTVEDEENFTITASRAIPSKRKGKRKSQDRDIRLLAFSTRITELSYAISDVQTRIFEIQELRHKPQTDGVDAKTTAEIDNAIMNMNERLEAIEQGMKDINESVTPFQPPENEPLDDTSERAVMLRKHAALQTEWDAVQRETDELQQELKEDKWITVFRTVTEQADGMMTSLEKAVNRCQDFIWQVHKRGDESRVSFASSVRSDKSPASLEVFNSLLGSFHAKKVHYLPATTKVLAIMDNGVRNRVTKNGEALRRHAESAKRWRVLQERIERTERNMEEVRKILVRMDQAPSETGSSKSGQTANGYLATPPSGKSRASSRTSKASAASTFSRSMSPLRKLAKKLAGSVRSPATPPAPLPTSISRESSSSQMPSSEPAKTVRRQRSSLFVFNGNRDTTITPDKGHKYSQSLTPTSSPSSKRATIDCNVTIKSKPSKQPWNSSTKVEQEGLMIPKRPIAKSGVAPEHAPLAPHTPRRSLSRSSNASSRPWSPVTSSISTAPSSNPSLPPFPSLTPGSRPASRAQTPGIGTTPRPRPRTPSGIPAPAMHWRSVSARQPGAGDDSDEADFTTLMQRAFSPALTYSTSSPGGIVRSHTPGGVRIPPSRPPSRSKIPLPSVHVSSESRPSSTMSFYRPESPLSGLGNGSGFRAQTPESTLKARAKQVPVYTGVGVRSTARPSIQGGKVPPSSYRDASTTRTPSRPASRSGAYTPTLDGPGYIYVPANPKDPLDAEFAGIVNAIPHGLLIERVDPPLKTIPKEGEEIRASYAFSNSLSRKVVTCRLTTLTRSGRTNGEHTMKKVMCRVGGGWQDLQLYMLNRQAGM